MSDVACSSLEVFVKDARRRGISLDEFVQGTQVSVAQIRDGKFRVPWSDFTSILSNIARFYSTDELVERGGAYLRSGIFRPFALVAGLLFKPSDFYRWLYTEGSPVRNIFLCVKPEYDERSPTRAIVTLTLRNGCAPSEVFNYITKGAVTDLPRLLAQPSANVQMEPLHNGVRYIVEFSSRGGRFAFLRKIISWPFTAFRAGRALKEAHDDLRERYFELDAAKQKLAIQATQLRTAYSISHQAHAELDLNRTLDSIARAFVTIGGFAGASVALDRLPMRAATSGEMVGDPAIVRELEAEDEIIGAVALWNRDGADAQERADLTEVVLPTVALALHGALAHAELVDAQEHLERRVALRTAELSRAHGALSESMAKLEESEKARTRIFANVNHEIRTPLTLVLLSVDELRSGGGFDEQQDRALAAVARNARKLLRLVDGLLLLAAGDEQKLVIAPKATVIPQLLAEVVEGFAASARSCDVTLRCDVEPGLIAEVDDNALDRMLSNLVSNAIKFTPPGGQLTVTAQAEGPNAVFTVRDTGVGISEDFLKRAFGRFEQDARPLRPGAVGSGIGLSIVRSLAEAHGGKAEVERLEVGTLFRVTLPRVVAPELKRPAVASSPRPRRSTPTDYGLPSGDDRIAAIEATNAAREHTVLVVEDDDELRARVVAILAPHFHVISSTNGEEALSLAESHAPDMLVSDVGLPGMDGLELTRRFHELKGNRLSPVLLLTALATLDNRLGGFEAGAVDYMTKPFDPPELVARVRAQLERRRVMLRLHESEKLAAIGTMSAGLAHEMRNPANAIVNAVQPLLEILPPEVCAPGSAVAELLEVMKDASAQIGRLSKQLLGFRRDGAEIATEVVPASSIIERSLAITSAVMKNVELRLDLRYVGDIACAPALIMQILCNLLDNAAHAAGAGGWVTVSTFADGPRLVCEVGDSGKGVPPLLRERIFEPFFTTKAPGEGTGLGLSTARQIAERHRGALYVRATEQSSVFRLELPLAPAASQSPRMTA